MNVQFLKFIILMISLICIVKAQIFNKFKENQIKNEIYNMMFDNNLHRNLLKSDFHSNKQITGINSWSIFIYIALLIFILRILYVAKMQKQIIEMQKRIVDAINIELAYQNEEISKQKEKIQHQHDIIQKQKEEIEHIHNELKSSISYAKQMQEKLLLSSSMEKIGKYSHFIFFKPKEILSGDFYWYTEFNNLQIFAVADCTGHGVPGGFMSILGITLLNEIVLKKSITKPNQILNNLRFEIITALKQKGEREEIKDGMDISLLVIESDKGICQWAGANNGLYIVAPDHEITILQSQILNNQMQFDNSSSKIVKHKILNSDTCYSLLEIEPDNMPIAIHPTMKDFTNYVFPIPENACFYLFSDGFADQFGGEKNKKYSNKRIKELLLSISEKKIEEQRIIIEKEFEQWKGNNKQIDDVTIVGIKIV